MSGEDEQKSQAESITLHQYDLQSLERRLGVEIPSLGIEGVQVLADVMQSAYENGSDEQKRKITEIVLHLLDEITPRS